MSPEFEKVIDLDHLPIFPLPVVLMPNEVLPLHIFEPKYREMLVDLPLTKNMFGLIFFEPEGRFEEKPPEGSIGCVAEVLETESLPDGRTNILSIGIIRFRLLSYLETDTPYLSARIDYFEDEADETDLSSIANEVSELFERMAKAAVRLTGNNVQIPEISTTRPEQLSFIVSIALNLSVSQKFELLSMKSTNSRLESLRNRLVESVNQIEDRAQIDKISRTNGHGNKKIDLG